MATIFSNIPVPAANGSGAAVDVSTMGAGKTVTYQGTLVGSVTIEISTDAGGVAFVPVHTFTSPGSKNIDVAARWIRTTVSGFQAGAGNVDVGANDAGTSFVTLPAPAIDGVGAQVDVSTLGGFVTATATGLFSGSLHIEISEDGVDWTDLFSFAVLSGAKSGRVVAQFMRVRRSGVQAGALPSVNVCAEAAATDRNLVVLDGGGTVTTIFVRSTGNDVNGNGLTAATAYRTLRRALQDVPQFIVGSQYVIDCTGMGVEQSADALVMAPHFSSDGFVINFTPLVPGGVLEGRLHIAATPTVQATVPVANRTGEVAQATTGLLTYTTTTDLGLLDAQQGRFIYGNPSPNFQTGIVAGNTAGPNSDIRVTHGFAIDAGSDLEIATPSATIENTGGADDAFVLRNQACLISVHGFGFIAAGGGNRGFSVEEQNARVAFHFCQSDGVRLVGGGDLPFLDDVSLTDKSNFFHGGAPQFTRSLFLASDIDVRMAGLSGADAMRLIECIVDGCAALGASGIDRHNSWNIALDRVEILNGTGDGVFCPPGGLYEIEQSQIHDCVGNGITTSGGKGVANDVDSSVGGANGGIGQVLTNGAQVRSFGTTSLSGTGGDFRVGGAVAGAYPITAGSEDDLAAAVPQLCRIFN